MQDVRDIVAIIPELTLSEQFLLRDRLENSINDLIELSSAQTDREQVEEMERRLEGYLAGTIPSQPADVAMAQIRNELGL